MSEWHEAAEDVYQFQDSCLVYAVKCPGGLVVVNAGTGRAADHLEELDAQGDLTVLLTHHFRDHTDGAIRFAEVGAEILGPYWDKEYLTDPDQHFRERQIWNSYDNRWDRFSPVRPIPVSGWMMDYETRRITGLEWEVIPTPAQSQGAATYIVTLNGQRIAFVGETICGPGRTGRIAPLQYNYNDLTGASNLWHSATRILSAKPDLLLPSIGEPSPDPDASISELKVNLRKFDKIQPGIAGTMKERDGDDIEEILPHLIRGRHANAQTHFVLSESGKVLALDFGYNSARYFSPQKSHVSNRRAILHSIDALKNRYGIERIDTLLITHFHDDHVNGVPVIQRLFDTEVWAGENFAPILESPPVYDRPCLWHEPIPVARHLPLGETFYWEEIPITLHPMAGHTRFSTLVCMEIDGTRVAHTGDQIFFRDSDNLPYGPNSRYFTNHVYKNGLDIGCYKDSYEHLERFRPELILTGHTPPYRPDERWYEMLHQGAQDFDDVHLSLMSLEDDDIHFGAESQGAKLKPYQVLCPECGPIELGGWVLNPFPSRQRARLQLIGPDGWESKPVEIELESREQKTIHVTISPPPDTRCRRQPVGLDLSVGDRSFGQVSEALITIGHPLF
jgi:glyoxylase-like metal-dependent hydrolase (beta-lactamase superfamily II)